MALESDSGRRLRALCVFCGSQAGIDPRYRDAAADLGNITSESADAVILTSSLGKVDELIHVSHRMRSIAVAARRRAGREGEPK